MISRKGHELSSPLAGDDAAAKVAFKLMSGEVLTPEEEKLKESWLQQKRTKEEEDQRKAEALTCRTKGMGGTRATPPLKSVNVRILNFHTTSGAPKLSDFMLKMSSTDPSAPGSRKPNHCRKDAFCIMRHCHSPRFDFCGNVLAARDPLEMITFCLTIHHLWGRTFDKHNQESCAVAYADDGYIKAKLSVALEVLSDIKLVLKEDTGLDINDKTKILVKGITAAEAHAAAQRLLTAHPSLAHLGPLLIPKAFVDNGYFGLGVPIGTDAFYPARCREKVSGNYGGRR